jgi:hypothetical protein
LIAPDQRVACVEQIAKGVEEFEFRQAGNLHVNEDHAECGCCGLRVGPGKEEVHVDNIATERGE